MNPCPPSAVVSMGTPKTGSAVSAAVMPGKWAAPPAPAMMTLKPAALAPFAKETSRSGVRCAETIRAAKPILSVSRRAAAWRIVSKSDSLPMIIATGVSTTDKWRPKPSMRRSFGHKRRGDPAQGAREGEVSRRRSSRRSGSRCRSRAFCAPRDAVDRRRLTFAGWIAPIEKNPRKKRYSASTASNPSPLLDRDHFHADAVALADVIFGRPKTMLFQECVKPLAGKIVVVLDLAPIGVDAIGVQQPHNWVVISPSADRVERLRHFLPSPDGGEDAFAISGPD